MQALRYRPWERGADEHQTRRLYAFCVAKDEGHVANSQSCSGSELQQLSITCESYYAPCIGSMTTVLRCTPDWVIMEY